MSYLLPTRRPIRKRIIKVAITVFHSIPERKFMFHLYFLSTTFQTTKSMSMITIVVVRVGR